MFIKAISFLLSKYHNFYFYTIKAPLIRSWPNYIYYWNKTFVVSSRDEKHVNKKPFHRAMKNIGLVYSQRQALRASRTLS